MNLIAKFCILAVFVVLFSCNGPERIENGKVDSLALKPLKSQPTAKKILGKWSESEQFYGVYRFTNDIIGIGFDLGSYDLDGKPKSVVIDSLYVRSHFMIGNKDELIDSTGSFNISYSKQFSEAVLKNDASRNFYIYGTRGMTEAKIERVLYVAEDCAAVAILQLSKIDTAKFGQPLIASKIRYNFNYQANPVLQLKADAYSAKINKDADYKDGVPLIQFAHSKEFFLAYADDFRWFDKKDTASKTLFPHREIFKVKTQPLKPIWTSCLDLFGIPCD